MSEPFFPPPQKKENAPYRAAAVMTTSAPVVIDAWPELREKPREVAVPPKQMDAPARSEDAPLAYLAWRLAAKLVALPVTVGILWARKAQRHGAAWPLDVLLVVGAVGILAALVFLYFRLRRDDG